MRNPKLFELGVFHRTHGYQGHLRLLLHSNIKELLSPEALFVFISRRAVPYFVDECQMWTPDKEAASPQQDRCEFLIHFEDIRTKEDASALQGKTAWGTESVILYRENQKEDLKGFTVFDQHNTEIGIIQSVMELPVQTLLSVKYRNREVLIPLAEQTLLSVDTDHKTMVVQIADGLLDL